MSRLKRKGKFVLSSLSWIQLAIGAIAGFALCWLLHLAIMAGVESDQARALDDQKTAMETQCALDKQLTKESNDDYRAKLSARDAELSAAKRLRAKSRAVVPVAQPSDMGEAANRQHDSGDGRDTELYDFAGKCEGYRLGVIARDEFMDRVWEGR